ncbi:hypothetical protein [Roseovarius nitratireducens]|uniref:hypothetical protein n=1 Tax=Roseovarius nitratireducens TaxID=2044597 RepID=UPI00197F450F|nr:hypothetical protein [Roseovarius nitratireducens]
MTTKPKVSKFRIRRSASTAPAAGSYGNAAEAQPTPEAQAGHAPGQLAGQKPEPPRDGQIDQTRAEAPGTSIDDIRREGLTGRELRMARRVAQKHGLAPTSDFDAVRLLRARGIDPFQRTTMLELVKGDGAKARDEDRVQLPQSPI